MPTIDTLPVDPNAKGVLSVRDTVAATNCGGNRHRVAKHKAKGKIAAKNKASKKKSDAADEPQNATSDSTSAAPSPTSAQPKAAEAASP